MCGRVSFGLVVSLAVIVVSLTRAPGSSAALLEAQAGRTPQTSPARISLLMVPLRGAMFLLKWISLALGHLLGPCELRLPGTVSAIERPNGTLQPVVQIPRIVHDCLDESRLAGHRQSRGSRTSATTTQAPGFSSAFAHFFFFVDC